MGAFGEKLRKQREQRGIALDAISNTTKISTRMLRALEEEHFDQLPGGVFNKGFVRAYARQVGLDEEETITDYLTALRESQIQAQTILPDFRAPGGKPGANAAPLTRPGSNPPGNGEKNSGPAGAERRKQGRRNEDRRSPEHDKAGVDIAQKLDVREQPAGSSTLPGFITGGGAAESSVEPPTARSALFSRISLAAALLLVTAGLAVWNSRRHRESATKPVIFSTLSSPAPAILSPAQTPAPSPKIENSPKVETKIEKKTAPASSPATSLAAKSPAAALPPSTNASMTTPAVNSAANPSPLVAKSNTQSAAAKPLATFTVLIRAEKTSWIAITADGKPVAHETLIAPAHTFVRATREVVVRAGNAAGISFVVNNKEIPASGNEGEVKTYVFDPTGISPSPQTQLPANN